ncbi:uridine phosphorylase 2-like [Arapaima gigas]
MSYRDEAVHVKNPYLDSLKEDILYPLNLGTRTHNLPEMFWDIKVSWDLFPLNRAFLALVVPMVTHACFSFPSKFVCVGGSANHMKAFAQFVHQELALPGDATDVQDICAGTDQYSTYKVGTVLSISVSVSSQVLPWVPTTTFRNRTS